MLSQIFSEPVSNALCYYQLLLSPSSTSDAVAYSCRPKAEPKTANNMVVLLRRTALQPMVSLVGSKGMREEDLLVDVAEHLRGVVSAPSVVSAGQFTYARHFERVERAG